MSGDTNRPMAGCDNDRLRSERVAREAGAGRPASATVPRSRQRVRAVLRRREAQSERRGQGVSTPSEPIGRPDTAVGVAGRSTRHLRLGVPTRRARHTRARPNRCGRGLVLRRGSSPRSPQARIRERAPGPWSGTGEASRFKRTSRFPTCQSSANQGASRSQPQGIQRLGTVRLRDTGVADQPVSQTVVCDTRAKTPPGAHRRVSYPVSDSMFCRCRAKQHGSETRADTPAALGAVFPSATRGGPSLLRHDTLSDDDL